MTFALVRSRALRGLESPAVTVEVHLANGLPSFTLVGLAGTEVKESRERVRAALQTSGLEFPHNKRVKCSQATFREYVQGRRADAAAAQSCPRGRAGVGCDERTHATVGNSSCASVSSPEPFAATGD